MSLFTVPATATYRDAVTGDARYYTQGTRIDTVDAVRFGMPGAVLDPAVSTDPLQTLDLVDDFASGNVTTGQLGSLGWAFTNGTFAGVAAEAGHPGIARRDTSATAATIARWVLQVPNVGTALLGADAFDSWLVFRLGQADADTKVRLGFSGDWSNDAPAAALYLEKTYADTQWFAVARNASAQTRSAALATCDTGWHKLRIRRLDAASFGVTLDAAPEVALSSNLPAAALFPGGHVVNQIAASKTVDLDFFRLRVVGLGR